MAVEKIPEEFEFHTTMAATYGLRSIGIGPIVTSTIVFARSLMPSGAVKPFSIGDIPFHLFLWVLGSVIFSSVCDIQILRGQFSYCRLFAWRSFPLDSITRVRRVFGPVVYVRVDLAGNHYRIVFCLGGDKLGARRR
jgi:hypothetical protein